MRIYSLLQIEKLKFNCQQQQGLRRRFFIMNGIHECKPVKLYQIFHKRKSYENSQ